MQTERGARASERGFTMIEVMVAIVVTAIAVFGVTGAVLGAMHAQTNEDVRASLDDDALAALSDVRMMTVYDATMLQKLQGRTSTMTRTLPNGDTETIDVTIARNPEIATATSTDGALTATERVTLYQQAPAPGSVVNE